MPITPNNKLINSFPSFNAHNPTHPPPPPPSPHTLEPLRKFFLLRTDRSLECFWPPCAPPLFPNRRLSKCKMEGGSHVLPQGKNQARGTKQSVSPLFLFIRLRQVFRENQAPFPERLFSLSRQKKEGKRRLKSLGGFPKKNCISFPPLGEMHLGNKTFNFPRFCR